MAARTIRSAISRTWGGRCRPFMRICHYRRLRSSPAGVSRRHSGFHRRPNGSQRCYPLKADRRRAFRITGLTWIVERSFARLGRNRRLSKDYEYRVQTAELMIELAPTRADAESACPMILFKHPLSE